jgi:hypothetical protein
VYSNEVWKDAVGPDRYRRAIYTFIKRTSGYPSFRTFDSSDRDTSLPQRISTNTPLVVRASLDKSKASLKENIFGKQELAALKAVGSLLFNLDSALTR